jgi:hypothetical protein
LGGVSLIAVTHIKEPFLYKESVEYDLSEVDEGSTVIEDLLDLEHVLPFGYPTEQYLFKIKNNVFEVISAHRKEKKNVDDDLRDFIDPGDLKVEDKVHEQTFFLFTNNGFHKEYMYC